ncbi:MAG: glycerol-3-phosphate 1-O-acyltransferase PlsY [Firmicutes bacterium]|jgi:glycerol-3-phosphate acyltransferase PlsY|nr:glycerol-3-phosphate 1-O-acyltransferase PlsY [Bacillota bacterium]HQD39901.1 glycerol-3-phosphate 1-O-acyltransferase PlsY [Bacillota bacterium]
MNWIWFVASYLLGSLSPGTYLAKAAGVDIQKSGSGNPGATNALRTAGWKVGLSVLFLDAFKGFLPVFLCLRWGPASFSPWVGLAAILGHNWSALLKLRGGKGMATSLGVMIALSPLTALILFGIWLLILLLSRYVSLASIVAGLFAGPVLYWAGKPKGYVIMGVIASLLIVYRHRSNISRLIAGTEYRFGEKAK